MKRRLVGISIMLVIMIGLYIPKVNAKDIYEITLEVGKQQGKELTANLVLHSYEGDGILGYQTTLQYKEEFIKSYTVQTEDGWDITTDTDTKMIIATTKNAKQNTKIATIVFTLQDISEERSTTIGLQDLIISDAYHSTTIHLEKQIALGKTIQNNSGNNNSNTITNTTTDTNTTTNTTQNTTVQNIAVPGNTNTTATIQVSPTIQGKQTDQTTAVETIPQTGVSMSTVIIISIMALLGIYGWIRYKLIPLK